MFNKLVMESVDTQHSTELLDNLQIRTFDAFLLKGPGPPPSRVPSREGRCPGRHHGPTQDNRSYSFRRNLLEKLIFQELPTPDRTD